ncbi:MAG: hypothetical protein AAF449_12420 [Myxococcota bacterium]
MPFSIAVTRGLGLALIAAAILSAEVTLTRLLSAGLFHHIAFVVVSTALFGTAIGGLAIAVMPALREMNRDRLAATGAIGFSIALPLLYAASQQVPLEPLRIGSDLLQSAWLAAVYTLLAIPFALGGLSVAAMLDSNTDRAPKLYAADLTGASAGCFIALAALYAGPSGLYFAAGLAWTAALVWGFDRRAMAATGVALVIAAAAVPLPLHISDTKVTQGGEPFRDVLRDPQRTKAQAWSPLGRIDVVHFGGIHRRVVLDAGVAAVRVPPNRYRFSPSDVSLPYELKPQGRVLIVGAGAGWEVAEALQFDAQTVDAVEINPTVAAESPARLRGNSRVTWHITDGRTFLHQPGPTYDAIILIHTISNAATAAGAMQLAEDYLLTVEALEAMRARLAKDGLLLITRPEPQLPSLIWNLRIAGIAPRQVWSWAEPASSGGFYSAVMVTESAYWSRHDAETVRKRLVQRNLRILFDPERFSAGWSPTAERLQDLLIPPISRVAQPPPAATDDRPYFRHRHDPWMQTSLTTLFSGAVAGRARIALESEPLAEASVIVLLMQTTLMAALVLLVPLGLDPARRQIKTARIASYFSCLGLGFMLVEVALVQRLGLLVGSPTLAFVVVFAGLIGGTAVGSLLSPRWPFARHAPLVAAAAVALLLICAPPLVSWGLAWPLGIRVTLAGFLVATTGIALGLPFPLGLQHLAQSPGTAAWALSFNGVASVAGTGLAILIGARYGLTVTMGLAVAAYLVAWTTFRATPPVDTD